MSGVEEGEKQKRKKVKNEEWIKRDNLVAAPEGSGSLVFDFDF